jgi:hypothetical protein
MFECLQFCTVYYKHKRVDNIVELLHSACIMYLITGTREVEKEDKRVTLIMFI